MHFVQTFLAGLAVVAPLVSAQIGGHCDPVVSEPNPLTNQPKFITGTVNGTVAILPISYKLARSIIPSQYKILKKQYKAWLGTTIAANQYPMMLQMELTHDIINKGVSAGSGGDFLRAGVSFPFVDRLGDGYTAMTYASDIIISSAASAAISSYQSYGYTVAPGYFSTCNGYEYDNSTLSKPPNQRTIDQASWGNDNTDLSNPDIAYRLAPVASSPYSSNFWYNVTNQPVFSTGKNCDNTVRRLNTAVTQSPYAPVNLNGDSAILAPYAGTQTAKTIYPGIYGLKLDQAYYQTQNVACTALKGFSVVNAS